MLDVGEFEVDWRILAARDPEPELLDLDPVGEGPVDIIRFRFIAA